MVNEQEQACVFLQGESFWPRFNRFVMAKQSMFNCFS